MVLDGLAPCFSFNEGKFCGQTHPNPQSKRVELCDFCLYSVGIIRVYWHGDNCEVLVRRFYVPFKTTITHYQNHHLCRRRFGLYNTPA